MKWTKEQEKVINTRNKNILVSAAAGSGKTAVLVERIIKMITDNDNPIDIDRLLVVTFTKAAASQMRERIGRAIEEKLKEEPSNLHLQRQLVILNTSNIMTIHSFCLNIIRNYFHIIGLDPSFRMAEESEVQLLRSDIVSLVLEKYYEEGDKQFLEFVESYSYSKSDIGLEEIIQDAYNFSISYPWPGKWLDDKASIYEVTSVEDLDKSTWMSEIISNIEFVIEDLIKKNAKAIEISKLPNGPSAYLPALMDDCDFLTKVRERKTYKEFYQAFLDLTFTRLSSKRQEDALEEYKNEVKYLREIIKDELNKIKKQFFYQTPEEMLDDIKKTKNKVHVLIQMTKDFISLYSEKKREKNIIDFNDLEHFALKILEDESVSNELMEHFIEILIDEYQDSNLLQETILNSISREKIGKPNIFMVGDVKQSIYKFRLAMPELFMNKFDTYTVSKEDDNLDSLYERIDLDKNFRSRDIVLEPVNHIFEQIMIKDIGGIEYNKEAFLKVGASYEKGKGYASDIECIIVKSNEKEKEKEAMAVAQKIKELVDKERGIKVLDDTTKEYRPAQYKDIVILFRTMVEWSDIFTDVLMNEGIPTYSETNSGYFQTLEIRTLISILQIIDNPRQDIPLAAVLHSSIVGLRPNDLGLIKGRKRNKSLYKLICDYIEVQNKSQEDELLTSKLKDFMNMLDQFRQMATYKQVDELIIEILNKTSYYDYIGVLPCGEQRQANIDLLIGYGRKFSNGSYKGLFHFIRYIEKLRKIDVDFGEALTVSDNDNSVRIMSIHKSKGLEFPIVFLSGICKEFNMKDVRKSFVYHFEHGIGLDYIDLDKRTKVASLVKKVLQNKLKKETIGEELRVLYVALTRAKEQLIITGQISEFDQIKASFIDYTTISSSMSYYDLLIPALINRGYTDRIKVIHEDELSKGNLPQEIFDKIDQYDILSIDKDHVYSEEYREKIKEIFNYNYPYINASKLKIKHTVTELKRLENMLEDEEAVNLTVRKDDENKEKANILVSKKELSATRGIVYHKIIEKMDLLTISVDNLSEYFDYLIQKAYLTKEELSLINTTYIKNFINSKLINRMRQASKNGKLYKETPFVIGVDSSEIYKDECEGEMILIQGMIDTFFEEDNELVLVDYKSDYISKNQGGILLDRYKTQMKYYKKALEQITNKRVKEVLIFSLVLGGEIRYE